MEMFSTKYPNNIRIVSGTVVLSKDDVVLECDTSTGPVIINLQHIPASHWNTTWKLYVIDNANNASVNNITINAGAGQKINNYASATINVNGGGICIRVLDNTNFIGLFSSPSSTPSTAAYITAYANADQTVKGFGGGPVYYPVLWDGYTIKKNFSLESTSFGNSGIKCLSGGIYVFTFQVTGHFSPGGGNQNRQYSIFNNDAEVINTRYSNNDEPASGSNGIGKVVGTGLIELQTNDVIDLRNFNTWNDLVVSIGPAPDAIATLGATFTLHKIDELEIIP